MRLCLLLLTAILAPPAAWAQSSAGDQAKDSAPSLPLDKIRAELETTVDQPNAGAGIAICDAPLR